MAQHRLGVLDGDGIGTEIVPATVRVIDAALAKRDDVSIEWVEAPIGFAAIEAYGHPTPQETLTVLDGLHGWIMGPHDSVAYPAEFRTDLNPSGSLRKRYDLFANIRPARNLPGIEALVSDTDLVIARENTEGFYCDRSMTAGHGELMVTPDVAIAVARFTRPAVERIAHTAFRLARTRRKHVTIVHKANVLRMTTGQMFRDVCREVGEQYPDVTVDDFHIDAMAALLVRRPETFDVIVTENMFGDILSDLTGELVGSLGVAGSINAGTEVAMAQAAHGSAPDIAGKGIANPVGMMVSAWQLLRWLGDRHGDAALAAVGDACEAAMMAALAAGHRTGDLGGTLGTDGFTDRVIAEL
jgi:3-isopropylmalate dehydrogenase